MKQIYSIILAVAMLAGTAVIADLFYLHTNGTDDTGAPDETVTIDGITYDLYYQTGNATVSKLTDTTLTSVTVPKTVESCTVTAIGESAFEVCTELTEIVLPDTITRIGNSAFSYCSSLTSIELPVATSIGIRAFYECSALTSINLPSATSIGDSAFIGCSALKTVNLLSSVESVGEYAFYHCISLTVISLPVTKTVGESAFEECSTLTTARLPSAVTVGAFAFFKCTSLTSVELPVATDIRISAFVGCSALTSIELPVATSIGENAFANCSSLTSIELPVATSIGNSAFFKCTSLTSINLPSATSIGDSAFFKCTSLDYIHLNTNNVTFGQFIVSDDMTVSIIMSSLSTASGTWLDNTLPFTPFVIYSTESPIVLGYDMSRLVLTSYGSGSSTQTFKLEGEAAKGLTIGTDGKISGVISETGMLYIYETVGTVSLAWSVQIEQCVIDNVIYLPDLDKDTAVAIGCTDNAGDITIPYSVEYAGHTLTVVSIREMAFNEKNLVTVVIGTDNKSAITEIPNAAFQSCLQLVSITLPDSIVSFGPYAFVNCISLALTQLPSGVVSIGPSAFEGCTALALTELPSGLGFIDTYTFRECVNLKLTSLPDGITTVSEHAFQGCTSLALASLNNVATVGDHAFDGCTGLTATFDLSTVGSVGEGAFTNTSDITFKVPLTGIEIGENALGTGYYAWAEDIVVDKAVSISVQNKTANTSYSISGTGAGGLTVTEDGTISGTPQMVGTFTVTAKAKNTSVATFAVTGEKILPFVLSADTLYCITGKTVPASDDDIVTIDSAVPSGYTVTWAVTDGSGCGITVVDGVIKGTAGATGTYTITIVRTVTGHGITQEDTAELTVVIVDVLKITSTAKDIVPA